MSLVRATEITFYQKHLVAGQKVLDFGCGDGFFLQTLKKFSAASFQKSQIFGLDLINNPRVCEIPKKLYSQISLYDGHKIPYQPNSFDTVIANCVFEHLPNLPTILKQLYQTLKPKGKLYATVMTNNWNKYLRLPAFFWDKVQVHHNLLSANNWQQQFTQVGFKVLNINGYLNQEQSRKIESSHFMSLPYLISYRLFKRWDIPGNFYLSVVNQEKVKRLFEKKVSLEQAAGLFIVLEK